MKLRCLRFPVRVRIETELGFQDLLNDPVLELGPLDKVPAPGAKVIDGRVLVWHRRTHIYCAMGLFCWSRIQGQHVTVCAMDVTQFSCLDG